MRLLVVVVRGGLLLGLAVGCQSSKETRTNVPAPQAIATPAVAKSIEVPVVEEKPLLLQDEPEVASDAVSGANNNRCRVCHLNLGEEELAVTHAKAGIGCAQCHGASDAHIADESWASGGNGTAPEIMYLRAQINDFCLKCHPRDKTDSAAHQTFWTGASPEKFCTDCHGKHRLVQRKCKWK